MINNVRGEFNWIDPKLLNVPRGEGKSDFQRPIVSDKKITEMSHNWLWPLCGALIVVKYPDGKLIVAEGGHRREAAIQNTLDSLPCMVFKVNSVAEAAEIFRLVNSKRSGLHPVDDQKAALVQGDALALKINKTVSAMGRTIAKTSGPAYVACVKSLRIAFGQDEDTAVRILMLMKDLCEGESLDRRIFMGLFVIEQNLRPQKTSLCTTYRERVLAVGNKGLLGAIVSEMMRTGSRSFHDARQLWVNGILYALNMRAKKNDIITLSPKTRKARKVRIVEVESQVGLGRHVGA